MLAALAAAAGALAAGCLPTRRAIYSEVHRSRAESYARWRRDAVEEEALPRLKGSLPVGDAIRAALSYSPTLRNVLQEKEKARGQLYTAYGEALPRVDLSAGYTRLDQVFTVDLGVASFDIGDRDTYFYQVTVTQPLFKGGSIPAAIRGARIFEALGDERIRQTVQDVVLQVAVAYYDVVLARHLYEVQREALQFARANLRDVTAREEAGVAIPFDRLRARVEVSNVEADMIRARNRLNRARTALLRAMGVSQRSEVTLSNELVHAPLEPAYEEAVRTAFLNRPELYQGELDSRLQRTALRIVYSDYFPELEAFGWRRWAKPDPHEASNIAWDDQWQAGVRLTWHLFDGLRREGSVIQQRAVLQQSILSLEEAEQRVLEEVRNGILDLADAEELVASQRLNLERAGEALRLVTVGAREGVNTELEVLDARAALTRARGLYYQALHSHVIGRLAFQRALGMLGPEPGRGDVPEEAPESVVGPLTAPAGADGGAGPSAPGRNLRR